MSETRPVRVSLCPELTRPGAFAGTTAVVIDVLRATTTMLHALAAGCRAVRPCSTIDDALALAVLLRGSGARVLLAGERDGIPVTRFDVGNSPLEFTPDRCRDAVLVMTTTNGTRALGVAAEADEVLVAAFGNLSATCEHVAGLSGPVHILCAGDHGRPALEDTLLAGAIVEQLGGALDDSAYLALAAWRTYRGDLFATMNASSGGLRLRDLSYHDDIRAAAVVDAPGFVVRRAGDRLERFDPV